MTFVSRLVSTMAAKYKFLRLIFRLTVLLILLKSISSSDDYVKDLSKKCFKSRRPFFCVTFRIAKFIQNFEFQSPENSVVKIVKVHPQYEIDDVLPVPRFISTDTEWDKFVKFLQRKLVSFLSSHGIAFEVPSGVSVIEGRSLNDIDSNFDEKDDGTDQPRGHHKIQEKKIFILSVLIMAKLIKILLLVNMIFYVLLFIKKIILVTAIVFPSILGHIKQACQKHHHHHPTAVIAEEAPAHSLSSSWFGWRQDGPEKRYW